MRKGKYEILLENERNHLGKEQNSLCNSVAKLNLFIFFILYIKW